MAEGRGSSTEEPGDRKTEGPLESLWILHRKRTLGREKEGCRFHPEPPARPARQGLSNMESVKKSRDSEPGTSGQTGR